VSAPEEGDPVSDAPRGSEPPSWPWKAPADNTAGWEEGIRQIAAGAFNDAMTWYFHSPGPLDNILMIRHRGRGDHPGVSYWNPKSGDSTVLLRLEAVSGLLIGIDIEL